MSQEGLLIRACGGFFDVKTDGGMLRCRARGRLHLDGMEPLPGDVVLWERDPNHADYGILTGIRPRRNAFIRPNVANLDQMIFVASVARPTTDPYLIDQMSVVAAASGCMFSVCINKIDLMPPDDLSKCYRNSGIPVIPVSAETGEGLELLRGLLSGKLTAMTGNSGVGKTSLLNLLLPGINRETAEISPKHGRGRHTTRLTEIFPIPDLDGYLVDTPGFAALEFQKLIQLKQEAIATFFPEFPDRMCRFPDCRHVSEPGCAVREAVNQGDITSSRYQSYLRMLKDQSLPVR